MTLISDSSATDIAMRHLESARELGVSLRSRSSEIEHARRLPDDVISALHEHDLLNLWKPVLHGGDELDPLAGLAILQELARHDSSVGWCCNTLNVSGLFAGRCDVDACRPVFGGRRSVVAGLAAPNGTARVVEGGLLVSGRWAWGSGIHAATAIGGGVLLVDDDGEPAGRDDGLVAAWVFFERDQVEVLDTWHALGVRGSGSTDYQVRDAFVPEGRWMPLIDPQVHVDRPLFHMPLLATSACGTAAVALGILDRAIEEFIHLADRKVPQGRRRTLAHRTVAQVDVAHAEATHASAKAFLDDTVHATWVAVNSGHEVSVDQRRLMRLAATDAVQRSAGAVTRLHRSAGGTAVYEQCPLERLFRDANTLTQHQGASEAVYETVGRLALGLETDTTML